jgi:hypothetical protein
MRSRCMSALRQLGRESIETVRGLAIIGDKDSP